MKNLINQIFSITVFVWVITSMAYTQNELKKHRVFMLSDFPPIGAVKGGDVPFNMKSDPDDMQSIVRFLLYANEFEIEGIAATAGTFAMTAEKKNILSLIDEYEKVYENLKSHDSEFPTPDYLRSVTTEGRANNHGLDVKWGKGKQDWSDIIGDGLDSETSNAIITAVDKKEDRPLWIHVWGGPREVAQAIWDVKQTRSKKELDLFISKLRIFLIAYQDATHSWLMDEFPNLFIIDSRKTYQGMFGGSDPISNLDWVNENIRYNHGPLCAVYPHEGMGCTGVCEGDSPTFMHLVSANRGINNPEDPSQPSWGGQYVRKEGTNHYVDGPGKTSISNWRPEYQKEFLERADWCIIQKARKTTISFAIWLKDYLSQEYPKVEIIDNKDWYQAVIPEHDITVSWAYLPHEKLTLKEVHGHYEGKSIFISEPKNENWTNVSNIEHTKGAGYYIHSYNSSTMGDFEVAKLSVLQFRGTDTSGFVEKMIKAWLIYNNPEVETEFTNWLKEYAPNQHPESSFIEHNGWYQIKVPELDLTISWGLTPEEEFPLYKREGLSENQTIFIAKERKDKWAEHASIKYYPDVGYYIPQYNSSTMASIDVGRVSVVHFDGSDPRGFIDKMAKEYADYPEKSEIKFVSWLRSYVQKEFPGKEIAYNGAWYQTIFPNSDLTVTWGTMSSSKMELRELHGLRKGKSIFIEKNKSTGWESIPSVEYIEGVGYNIPKYDESAMGHFEVGLQTVIQYNGDNSKEFTKVMIKDWKDKVIADSSNFPFMQWLFKYIPTAFPNVKMTDHKYWYQAHIGDDLIVNWSLFGQKNVNLKYIEDHNLTQGKNIFIQIGKKMDWVNHPKVTYFKNVGYYVEGYVSSLMSNWVVEGANIIQFDGDGKVFSEKMVKAWLKSNK
ncbi:DUF1593 domain-containing protein [Polaribacter reichenbachii]|uniref:DUF1593 domain-containing protein n=1 Tax=Polaribacter reichenbachii TaxID=996801 RepID=UPI0009F45870|nr:DUF1593 domain-containing protein [Polaribacter reichenbachii]